MQKISTREQVMEEALWQMEFIVRLKEDLFFADIDPEGRPKVTPIPGLAKRLSFDAASALVKNLRSLEYQQPVVADLFGEPLAVEELAAVKYNSFYYLVFSNHYYSGLDAGNRIIGSQDKSKAKPLSYDDAREYAKILRRGGHRDVYILRKDSKEKQ